MKYQVFKDPNSMNSRTVCLNYSNVFTEDEVLEDAKKAMASHSEVVPNSLIIERVESDSSTDDVIQQLCDDVFYPVVEDKDWLRRMTSDSYEAPISRKRALPPASSPPKTKRSSLRLHDKEKEPATQAKEAGLQLDDDFAPDVDMDSGPSSSSSEDEDSTSPKPSTSKSSKKSKLTPKERFKGKVFQVKIIPVQ